MVELAVVGGSALYRESIRRVLEDAGGIEVVGTPASLAEAAHLVERGGPDVLVVDLQSERGLAGLASMKDRHPDVRLVALGVDDDEATVIGCAAAGVVAYLARDTTAAELVQAVKRVAKGELVYPPPIVETLVRWLSRRPERATAPTIDGLTRREREVIELVGLGLSNKQIAQRLSIQVATVKSHVHSILTKLGLDRRAEVVALLRDTA
ncbi:MAG TPA: response regulator transcription factor [Thermoleophilaceae bacterium]|jgi:DNA-binding NarL/FixJ family response regulator